MAILVVENGNLRGQRLELEEGQRVVLGRDPAAALSVEDKLCSREHFEVRLANGRATLTDLGSSNGTWVNDLRVTEHVLTNGDSIRAGETMLTWLVGEGSQARGLVGKTIGGYRILDRIGRGGMGTVYKAEQVSLKRVVALKILSPKVAADPAFVRKFQAEARAAGALNHPNIVQVYDVGSDKDLHFFSMELIENGSVQDLATREGALEIGLALDVVIDAARGLEYAEKRGIVHRDIKPDNLMINAEGVVKIADLGLARDAGKTAREGGGVPHEDDEGIFGTPHFIAPEQALGRAVDTRSDIYSLGASFYRLVTGETPFHGEDVRAIIQAQIHDDPIPVRERRKECPKEVAAVIEKMMRKDPDERYATVGALLADLDRAQDALDGKGGKGRLVAVAAGIVLVIGVGAAIALSGGGGSQQGAPKDREAQNTTPAQDDPARRAEADELARQQRLLAFGTALQLLKSEELAAAPKTEADLTAWIQRYADLVQAHSDVPDAADQVTKFTKPLEDARASLQSAAAERAAEDARRTAAAEEAVKTALARAEAAKTAGAPAEALQELYRGLDARALERRPERSKLETALEATWTELRRAVQTAEASADALSRDGDAKAALAALAAQRAALGAVNGISDLRMDELSVLAKRLDAKTESVRSAARAAKAAALAADQTRFLKGRRGALDILRRGFDPAGAVAVLEEALSSLQTEEYRAILSEDLDQVRAAVPVLDKFRAAWTADQKPRDVELKSAAANEKAVVWRITALTAEGVSLTRGRFKREARWTEFQVGEIWSRFLEPALGADAEVRQAMAFVLLMVGEPDLATAALVDSGSPSLAQRFATESNAWRELSAIRALEARAGTDDQAWLDLLPLTERFLNEHRSTYAFALASDGSTPMVLPSDDL